MKKRIQKDEMPMDYVPSSKNKAQFIQEVDERQKKQSKGGIIRNKFKQMKSQEAINDYYIGMQKQQMIMKDEQPHYQQPIEIIQEEQFPLHSEHSDIQPEAPQSQAPLLRPPIRIDQVDSLDIIEKSADVAENFNRNRRGSVVPSQINTNLLISGQFPASMQGQAPSSTKNQQSATPLPQEYPNLPDFQHKSHDEFLRGITTIVNMETDLHLYHIDRSFSNHNMGVVGIQIIGPNLQEAYGGKKYIIRAYSEGKKFFELTLDEIPEHLDVHQDTIAWVYKNSKRTFYFIDVSGGITNFSVFFKEMKQPETIQHTFFEDRQLLQSFKIGSYNYDENTKKLMIMTSTDLYVLPFTISYAKEELESFDYEQRKINSETDLELINLNQVEDQEQEEDGDYEEYLIMLRKNAPKIKRYIDYSCYELQQTLSSYLTVDGVKEFILCQDEKEQLILLQNSQNDQSDEKYIFFASISLKDINNFDTTAKFQILDGIIIQTNKIALLIKVSQKTDYNFQKNEQIKEQIDNFATVEQMKSDKKASNHLVKVSYKIQIWDIKQRTKETPGEENKLKCLITFGVSEQQSVEVQQKFRQNFVQDLRQNDFYIPEYNSSIGAMVNRVNIKSTTQQTSAMRGQLTGNFETLQMNMTHIFDFLGQHHKLEAVSEKLQVKNGIYKGGLLYQDFLVHQNLLFIAHGLFVSVIDLNMHTKIESHQHILPIWDEKDTFESSLQQSLYSQNQDVHSIILVDKDSMQINQRWKIIVAYQGDAVKLLTSCNQKKKKQPLLAIGQDLKSASATRGVLKVPQLALVNFMRDQEDADLIVERLPGTILKVFKNQSQLNATPLFLINNISNPVLCKLDPNTNKIQLYSDLPDITEHSGFFILNNELDEIKNENILQLNVTKTEDSDTKSGKKKNQVSQQKAELEHLARILKLRCKASDAENEAKRNAYIIKEENTPNLSISLVDASDAYVSGDHIYFLFPNQIIKYNIPYNAFEETIKINENIQKLLIFEDKYFYWRQFARNDFFMPLSSYIFFDGIEATDESDCLGLLKKRCLKLDLHIFNGLYPHLPQLLFDPSGEQIGAFIDYNRLAVIPMLHQNEIKIKCPGGMRTEEPQILASKMFGHTLCTLHNDNALSLWNMKNGQLISSLPTKQTEYQDYKFQQKINQNTFLLKRVKDSTLLLTSANNSKNSKGGQNWSKKGGPNQLRLSVGLLNKPIDEDGDSFEGDARDDFEDMENIWAHERFSKSKQSTSTVRESELLRTRYGINSMDLEIVQLSQYKVIEIVEIVEKQPMASETQSNAEDSDSKKNTEKPQLAEFRETLQDPLSKYQVKDVFNFEGPSTCFQSNNFGLFVSEDMHLFTFYFKDVFKTIQTMYYQLKPLTVFQTNATPGLTAERRDLKLICRAIPNTWLSTHSNDFRYYLKQNQNEQLEITPFDHTLKDGFVHEQYNLTTSFANVSKVSQSNRPKTMELEQLKPINEKIRNLSAISPDTAPSFIAKDKIAFMSHDNVILCYKVFENDNDQNLVEIKSSSKTLLQPKIKSKEVFNVSQCPFPGSTQDIALDSLFMQDCHLIGENIMLMETKPIPLKPQWTQECVGPNYYNTFLIEQACNDIDNEDAAEMKYIQNRFKTKIELMPKMYTGYIFQSKDFLGPNSFQTSLYIVNTFSFYQWRAISLLKRSRCLIEDFSKSQLQRLSFAQLQNGKTLLHALKNNPDAISQLFENVYDSNIDKIPFYIPVFEDRESKNVLMALLEKGKQVQGQENEGLSLDSYENNKSAVTYEILKNIANYPYDLFKIRLNSIVRQLINMDFLKFVQFMEHRIRQPSMLTQVQLAKVQSDAISIFTRDDLWNLDETQMRKQIESNQYDDLKRVEICILDVYLLHLSKNKDNNRYNINIIYEKLAETDSLQVFTYNSVKALIEVKWRYIQKRIVLFQLLPYLGFMICFVLYTGYDLEYYDSYVSEGRSRESTALRILIWIFISYFVIMEVRQTIISGINTYLRTGWNYMDICIYSSVIAAEIIHGRFNINDPTLIGDEDYIVRAKAVRAIYSFAAIIMWIRLLYYFRIFRNTGYYIRMLVQVVLDIRYFIFIFVLTILAFAHAWFVFLKNNSEGTVFVRITTAVAYVYKIAIGDFDTDLFGDYYSEISWFFFVFATFLLQIVLINLLISIVADTFSNIKSNYNVIMYKDMLHMIIENRFLAVGALTEELNHKHLLMALPIQSSDDKESTKPVIFRNDNSKVMLNLLENIETNIREQSQKQNEALKRISAIENIEDNEMLILERLQQIEERQKLIMTSLIQQKAPIIEQVASKVINRKEDIIGKKDMPAKNEYMEKNNFSGKEGVIAAAILSNTEDSIAKDSIYQFTSKSKGRRSKY